MKLFSECLVDVWLVARIGDISVSPVVADLLVTLDSSEVDGRRLGDSSPSDHLSRPSQAPLTAMLGGVE